MALKSPRRVLIVQPYGIGDLLFMTPVLRALRLIPRVEIVDLLLGSRTEALVAANPHVDKIFVFDKDRFHRQKFFQNLQDLRQLGRTLAARKYDLLLDFSARWEYGFWGKFFLNIPRRAGYAYKKHGFFHNIRLPILQGFNRQHVTEYCCELAHLAGIEVQDKFLEFYPQAVDREAASAILQEKFFAYLQSYAVISPGGGESWGVDAHFKRWPAENFSKLIHQIQARAGFKGIVILGSDKEKELGQKIQQTCKIPAINFSGDLSLATAAAIVEKAKLFIGNDGGLMHLACSLQVPVIAFYGPVDPMVYGPYPPRSNHIAIYKENLACRPCYQRFRYNSACPTRECLQDISPEEAVAFLEKRDFFASL